MSKPFIFNIDYTNNLQNNEHNIYRQRLIKCDFAKILQNKTDIFLTDYRFGGILLLCTIYL